MAVKIGSNIESLKTLRQLGRATDALSTVNERLASGQRINHAADDAAGLAIASSLNAKAKVYNTAKRNISDSVSAVSIASDAVSALTDITIRQKELAEQAANGAYSNKQRSALDKEGRELTNEYNRIVSTTQFNGVKLLDNPWDSLVTQVGIGSQASIGFKFADELSTKLTPGGYFLLGDGIGQSYVWFTVDGIGTDPLALDSSKGIRVDLNSAATPATAASFQIVVNGAIPGLLSNQTMSINLPSYHGYFWFDYEGTGSDPGDSTGQGLPGTQIQILSSDTDLDISNKLIAAFSGISSLSVADIGHGSPNFTVTDLTTGAYTGPPTTSVTGIDLTILSNGTDANVGGAATKSTVASAVLSALNATGTFTASLGSTQGELIVRNGYNGTIAGTRDVNSGIVITDTVSTGSGRQSYSTSTSPNGGASVADLDGDGTLDFVTPDFDSSTVSVFLNQGNGTFTTRIS